MELPTHALRVERAIGPIAVELVGGFFNDLSPGRPGMFEVSVNVVHVDEHRGVDPAKRLGTAQAAFRKLA